MEGYTDKEMRAVIDKSFDSGYNHAIDKACEWLKGVINIEQEVKTDENGEPLADSYIDYAKKRLEVANKIIEEFKNYMKEKDFNNYTSTTEIDEKQEGQNQVGTDFHSVVKNLMNLHKIKNEFTEEDYDFQTEELLKLVKQKHIEWSEEDRNILNAILLHFNAPFHNMNETEKQWFTWLKSLPDRFNLQPQQ